MINLWHGISSENSTVAVTEMPRGSMLKYVLDRDAGALITQGRVRTPVPANFGFIPQTMDGHGEPLGIFVYSNFSLAPMSVSKVDVERVLSIVQKDIPYMYIIATLSGDYLDWRGAERRTEATIEFLTSCSSDIKIVDLLDHKSARAAVQLAKGHYKNKFGTRALPDNKE